MIFLNYDKVDVELDRAFNTHKEKTREGQGGKCMACAHEFIKNHRRRNWNLQRRIPRNPMRGEAGHKPLPPHNQ